MTKYHDAAPGAFRVPVQSEFTVYMPVVVITGDFAPGTDRICEGEAAATVESDHADASGWKERASEGRDGATVPKP